MNYTELLTEMQQAAQNAENNAAIAQSALQEAKSLTIKINNEQLEEIKTEKENIRQAIVEKGQTCPTDTPFNQYANKIRNISTGSQSPSGSTSFYKCISVDDTNGKWIGEDVYSGEQVEMNYVVAPEIGYIYDATGKVHISETRRDLGYHMYRRRTSSSGMGYGVNLDFIDQVDGTQYSTKQYYFNKVKNHRFKDYVVISSSYALAIGYDNNLYSWGYYEWGDCISGQGSSNDVALENPNPNTITYEPRLVDNSGNWEKIFAVYQNTWVLNSNGELYRCGRNNYGELGFGNRKAYWKLTKLEIDGVSRWKKVALCDSKNMTFLLSEDGRAFISGGPSSTYYGELGVFDPYNVSTLSWSGMYGGGSVSVTMSEDGNTITVSSSDNAKGTYTKKEHSSYTLYYEKNDDSRSYIYANGSPPSWYITVYDEAMQYSQSMYYGSSPTSTNSFVELKVNGVSGWKDVFIGYYNAGAISSDGKLFVWGRNNYGQLGVNNSSANQYSPMQIGTDKTWETAGFGDQHLLAITTDGTLWGTGRNYNGTLGLGSNNTNYYSLTQVGDKSDWNTVKCKSSINLFIDDNNKVYYCGSGSATYGGGSSSNETAPTYHGYKIGNYKRCDFERILTNEWDDSDVLFLDFFRSSSTFTIPDGVTQIKKPFFNGGMMGSSYTTVYIPKSVKTISSDAFSNLYSTKIIFEAEQAELPTGYPWGHQGGDSYFTYGATFEHIKYNEVLAYLVGDSFPSDYILEIPDGVSLMYKFQNYTSLTTVKIPGSIQSLEQTFTGCSNLTTVYLGNIDSNMYLWNPFSNCPKLTKIYCNWTRGEKSSIESSAPWGATSATVIYKDEDGYVAI